MKRLGVYRSRRKDFGSVLITFLFSNLLLLICQSANADAIRVGASLGSGSGSVNLTQTGKVNETVVGFFADYAFTPFFAVSAEHTRGAQLSASTSVATSNVLMRYYFMGPMPQNNTEGTSMQTRSIDYRTWAPYVGLGGGFMQSSLVDNSVNQATYLGVFAFYDLKLGVEFPVWNRYGLRLDFDYAGSIAGSGSANTQRLMLGFYFFL